MIAHPKTWRIKSLEELADVQTGLAKGKTGLEDPVTVPYLRVANVQDGFLDLSEVKNIQVGRGEMDRYRLRQNDVLLTEGGDLDKLGRGVVWHGQIELCLHQNHVFVVRTRSELLRPQFLALLTASPYGRRYFLGCAKRTTNLASINATQLKQFPVLLPSVSEQDAMASLLGAWNAVADALNARLEAGRSRRLGLIQQLLTGQTRFKEFEGQAWQNLALGEILTFEPRVVTKPKGAFLAAGIRSHGKGVFLKPDFEGDDIALDELFQLRTDDLVVNITFAWEGAVAIVPPEADGALVSHRFPTFTFKRGVSFPGYFRHVIRRKRFVHELGLVSPGGAGRNRVLSKSDFLRIRVELPSFEEQQRIAAVLDASDREIELLQKQLGALKEQKRGLMHNLLTGEVRVKGEGRRQKPESGVQNGRQRVHGRENEAEL